MTGASGAAGVDEQRLREALLRHLVRSEAAGPISEMAREVLAGRMTAAGAAGSLAYGEHLTAAAAEGAQLMRSRPPEELAEAQQTLGIAASILDPPVPVDPPVRPGRPDDDDGWDESVTSPWDES